MCRDTPVQRYRPRVFVMHVCALLSYLGGVPRQGRATRELARNLRQPSRLCFLELGFQASATTHGFLHFQP